MTDIFISYSRNDRERVRIMAEALEKEGFDVWWDPEIPPGESFSAVIDEQLKNSACIIAVWSNSSVTSNWVQEEADDGMQRNTLIPVMIDGVDLPRGFKRLQTADLQGWTGDTSNPNWQLIITQVKKLVTARQARDAAEQHAAARNTAAKTQPRQALQSARPPAHVQSQSNGGGFPVMLVMIVLLVALVGGGGAFWFMSNDNTDEQPARAEAVNDADKSAVAEPTEAVRIAENMVEGAAQKQDASQENKSALLADSESETSDVEAQAAPAIEASNETTTTEEDDEVDELASAPIEEAATIQAGATFRDCDLCPELVALPVSGSFMFGAPENEPGRDASETPQIEITFAKPFAIGIYEVTYDEWAVCLADGGCNGHEPQDLGWGEGRRPVINVSYEDAQAYLTWLSDRTGQTYRLPSEAEWEYAARAGTTTPFSFGERVRIANANFNAQYPYNNAPTERFRNQTLEVGSFAPNEFGLFDVHGNAWEWTSDCWRPNHTNANADGSPVGGACSSRTIKGGGWNSGGFPFALKSSSIFKCAGSHALHRIPRRQGSLGSAQARRPSMRELGRSFYRRGIIR